MPTFLRSEFGRFKSTYANRRYSAMPEEFRERRRGAFDPALKQDVLDGDHCSGLCDVPVTWDGETQSPTRRYFQDPTDLSLGLSTDGVPLYNRSRVDAWPLLIMNYSLPPGVRTKKGYQLCCGILPGM